MSRLSRQLSLVCCTFLTVLAGLADVARADCIGGKNIKGSFGVNVAGPLVGGSTAESFNGILKSNGKCGLKGTLTGGIFGQSSITQAVNGGYSVPANEQGTVTLQLPGSSTSTAFNIGLARDGKSAEITGVAGNGSAIATIEMVAIPKRVFGLSSLSGTYVATCTGAGNDGSGGLGNELAYVTFDGTGNVAVTSLGNNNGHFFSVTPSGTYSVMSTGAFTIQYPSPFSQYVASGEIVGDGSELRSVDFDTTAGNGAYRSCVARKQS